MVSAREGVRFDRSHFKRFTDAGLEFETVYHVTTADYRAYMDAQQAINLALLDRFRARRIGFAAERPTMMVARTDAPALVPTPGGPALGDE